MMTRKIIKKILPNKLPLAVLLITSALSCQVLADGKNDDSKSSYSSRASKSNTSESSDSIGSKRIKILTYNESDVYLIRTKYGYQTNIIFDPKEEIKTISVGNRSLWQLIPSGNRLFIRPMTDNISTNMSLITNKHSYEFDLKSVDGDSENNIYVARFAYPDNAGFEAATVAHTIFNSPAIQSNGLPAIEATTNEPILETKKNSKGADKQQILKLPETNSKSSKEVSNSKKSGKTTSGSSQNNYSYTYTGPDEIAPLQVYDDGKSTFVKYQKISKPTPSAFIIDANGKESGIASTVKGSSLVINDVASEILLRSSAGEIKIYNESLSPR